jgi:predicted amidohydrolase
MTHPSHPFSAGFLQFDVQFGSVDANLYKVKEGLEQLSPEAPAMIALPEMWATGFDYSNLSTLAGRTQEVLATLAKLANRYGIFLAGSLPEQDAAPNTIYNTMFITGPEGVVGRYRKQRVFPLIDEDQHLTPGNNPAPIDTPLGRIAGLVCYDLRFPELLRTQTAQGANLVLVSAQWPLVRIDHWRTLLIARAIENQIFVVAANRSGADSVGGGIVYGGHSLIVAPDGETLHEAGEGEESAWVAIETSAVDAVRARFNTTSCFPVL